MQDLRSPPGNRLDALKGDLGGYHSIRVNDRWWLVSRWSGNNAYEVRLMDYRRE
jgi:proteic killer suppression protein